MSLALVVGPAKAGKIARLLDGYLAALDRDPVLIVPNRSDVDRVERDLLARAGALLGGSIGTFDDLFRRLAEDDAPRPVAGDVQRALVARRALAGASLNGLARSARFAGFADTLLATLGELEAGLVEPEELEGDVATLYGAYRAELDRLGLWDRDLQRRHAVERLRRDLSAWDGQPVFAYGFEDLTAAEWALLEALAGRAEVTVSLPYEPGRPAFASLRRTVDDLAALADGRVAELPPRAADWSHPALAHLERALFADAPPAAPPLEGAVRFYEGAGTRGTLELVADEILEVVAAGTRPEDIAVVAPSLDRWRAPLETVFGTLGVPYALEGRLRVGQTPFGHALLSLLRFAWQGGDRRDLYAYLRSPYSGFARTNVDFLEGRLRGRAVVAGEQVEAETVRLRDGHPLPALEALRAAATPVEGVRALTATMLRNAHGLEAPPVGEAGRQDLRAHDAVRGVLDELDGWSALGESVGADAVRGVLDELDGWSALGESVGADAVLAAVERASVRLGAAGEPGRVAVLDLLRARTRRYDVVFVLGLEEGSLPRRATPSPFLDDDTRRDLDGRRGARLVRPDGVSRDRYLFYTACTRASRRLYLVREAATDDGGPREPSPFWEEVAALFDPTDVARWTARRRLSDLTWRVDDAPTERERLRALAALPDAAEADALAAANGWERRLTRARTAFRRPTQLTNARVLGELGARTTFNVTELERFADCSSAWFVERLLEPKTIDREVDAMLRGSVAHTALHRFFAGLPKAVGTERVEEAKLEESLAFLRECLAGALEGVRLEMTDLERRELEVALLRDLEEFVRDEARSALPFVPRRFEVAFGSERAPQELQRGLDLGGGLTLSGKIDRIDVDPFGARGIVQDYKSGRTAHSAAQIEGEKRLQIPLYMLVLRDLVGLEPLGGLYRPLAGERKARGMLRAEEELPGLAKADQLDEETFWNRVDGARELARGIAERIRIGDVRHDPKGDGCPAWCDLWRMCRVKRA